MPSIIGHEAGKKPFPLVIERNKILFRDVRTVLDIGAGRGRFVEWFKNNVPSVDKYIAVEPFEKSVCRLKKRNSDWPALIVYKSRWEDVRDILINKEFDVVIVWDVAMYMDLRAIHGGTCTDAVLAEIPFWINMTKRYLLFSLHPVKPEYSLVPRKDFKKLYKKIEEGTEKKRVILVDKSYLNRLYKIISK